MTARAVRHRTGFVRWAVHCPACPMYREIRPGQGGRETAERVAAIHNDTHHKPAEEAS